MMSTDDKATSCGGIKGNLVANCSFEKTKVKGNTFSWFKPSEVPDWVSMNGEDIELWGEGFKGVHASDGMNLIEIDSHKSSRTSTDGISQFLDTVAGQKYIVTFDMRARGNSVDTNDEALVLEWNGYVCCWQMSCSKLTRFRSLAKRQRIQGTEPLIKANGRLIR